jgi:hypothetical protein
VCALYELLNGVCPSVRGGDSAGAVAAKEIIIIMTHSNFIYTERERAKGHAVRFSLSAIYFGAKVRQNTHSFSNIYLRRAPTPFVR